MPVDETASILEEHRNREAKNILVITALSCLVLYLILSFLLPLPVRDTSVPQHSWIVFLETQGPKTTNFAIELRAALGATLITFAMFSAVLEYFRATPLASAVKETIIGVIAGDAEIASAFSEDIKRSFVKNSLVSMLGKEIGLATYHHVSILMDDEQMTYRTDFCYDVSMVEQPTYASEGLAGNSIVKSIVDSDDYRWMKDVLTYKRYRPEKREYVAGPFKIAIAFHRSALEKLFSDQDIFYRLMFELDKSIVDNFDKYTDEELIQFITDFCCLKTVERRTRSELSYRVDIDRENYTDFENIARPVVIITVDDLLKNPSTEQIEVSLIYPYSKEVNHFTFTIPQPTKKPRMSFRTDESVHGVEEIFYMSGVKPENMLVPRDLDTLRKVEVTKGWVFPTSGFTVTWKS